MKPLPPSAFLDCAEMFRKDIEAWVNHGVLPATVFLTAVIRGDLKAAYRHSRREQLAHLVPIVRFLDYVEERCWGSPEAVANWMLDGGLTGKANKLAEYERGVATNQRLPPPAPPPRREPRLPPTQQEIERDDDDENA